MKRFTFLGFILLTSLFHLSAQNPTLSVPFIKTAPVIDGLPDTTMNGIRWQKFTAIEKSAKQNRDVAVRYKLGYNCTSFYLLIESSSDSITCRDRAYQNGDGFHLVIAKPVEGGKPTDEFYVLRFSPENTALQKPAKKSTWYYNISLSGQLLSDETQFVCSTSAGKSYFELLLPWREVYPYQPIISASIGINLCFVKAIGEKEKNYYFLKKDNRIQNELSPREYLRGAFAAPGQIAEPFTIAQIGKSNIRAGETDKINLVINTPAAMPSVFHCEIRSTDPAVNYTLNKKILLTAGTTRHEAELPVETMPPGKYYIRWESADNSQGIIPLTILPLIDFAKEKETLERFRKYTTPGNYTTLLFMLQNVVSASQAIKPYETAGTILDNYNAWKELVTALAGQDDRIAGMRGVFRRAFESAADHTLQPYSIKVPDNYNNSKNYPLLVMLHGSGSDDTGMLNGTPLTENNFIEIAPYGRGTSNCFTADGAQTDIREAIGDVIRNYSIDTTRIIIAGFSMGGYGAYRTFYENPERFKGVAVFSGHPNLATKWLGPGYPDFLQEKYFQPFRNVPVFIYHSRNDLNCPYSLTETLVTKLMQAGAKVDFVTTGNSGHGILDEENIPKYYEWLRQVVK